MLKKISIILLAFVVIFSITSCSKSDEFNIPYGNLSDNVYASIGDYKVTEKELYNNLHQNGSSMIDNQILRQVYADDMKAAVDGYKNKTITNNFNYKEEFDSIIFNAVFSTTDVKTVAALDTAAYNTDLKKYSASLLNYYGIELNVNELAFDLTADKPTLTQVPDQLIEHYSYDVATKENAKAFLEDSIRKEKDEDGLDNSDYLDEDNFRIAYATYCQKFLTTSGIVIKFNSKADADNAIAAVSADGYSIENNALDFYIALYNQYYNYRTTLIKDTLTSNEDTNFKYDKDGNELTTVGSEFATFYTDALKDNEYLSTPREIDGKYSMIYKYKTTYTYGNKAEETSYDALDATQKEQANNDIRDLVVEGRLTDSYVTTKANEVFKNLDITFNDSTFRASYITNHSSQYEKGYKTALGTDNNLIYSFTYNDKKYTLSVSDFFDKLENIYGVSTATNLLINKYLLANYLDKWLSADDKKDLKDKLDDQIKQFNDGKLSDYPKSIGEENYLTLAFGYNNTDDVLKYHYYAQSLNTYYASKWDYYPNLYKEENGEKVFNTSSSIFNNFKHFTDKAFDNLFSLDVTHMLISVDDKNDGTMDDPKEFRATLSEAEKVKFDQAVVDLANAIVAEAKNIDADIDDTFAYIVKAYNNDLALQAPGYEGKTWADFKKYNMSLKTETLGEISNSNASNYVYPFSKHAKELYNKIKDDFDKEDGYLEFSDSPVTNIDQICTTNYGFHIFDVTDLDKFSSNTAKYTVEQDYKLNSDDQYKIYEHISVDIANDTTNPTEVYTNGYSDTPSPSVNQLFVYFYQNESTDGVTALRSSVKNTIDNVFKDVIARWKNTNFQKYRLLTNIDSSFNPENTTNIINIDFGTRNAENKAKLDHQMLIAQDQINNYTDENQTVGYIFGDWFNYNWTK